ncbi:MAG: pyrimidine/purine nucleoside phosphorylase [Deltaproteobacteria bacterium]|nr:pyrimidine/purine nucleoside phosphorylase [Deltaproteobacteria bacterium]
MSEFRNVTVVREANVYFGGGVTSRTILFADGSKKTLGILNPGEYDFDTGAAELMEILSGVLEVRLPGSDEWKTVGGGESFSVPAQTRFSLRVRSLSDYCCSFLP